MVFLTIRVCRDRGGIGEMVVEVSIPDGRVVTVVPVVGD
jgi:hypothetical protein